MSIIRRLFTMASLALVSATTVPATLTLADESRQPPVAPTFRVFATREGLVGRSTANGHRIQPHDRFVALPSRRVLASNGGHEFQIRVTYGNRSTVLPVWDVGPWNADDDYWLAQRRHNQLPIGLPMAQAAYLNNYNGGRDDFGRRIDAPNGIDIADGAFWDDLGMTQSDWVQVTFLWLGTDPKPIASSSQEHIGPEQVTLEPEAIAIDNGGKGYSANTDVQWNDGSCGLNGSYVWANGKANPSQSKYHASWTPALSSSGFYEAFAYIPACHNAATQAARYRVIHDGVLTEVTVDQQATAGTWASLGVYHISNGPAAIELSDVTGDNGRAVLFDAVKWLPRTDTTPPDTKIIEMSPRSKSDLLVRWGGTDDVSGIAAYDVQVRHLPDGGWTDWQIGATTSEAVFTPAQQGSYDLRIRARDWAGNQQTWRENNQTVDMGS